jgi:hypothetical protein
MAKEIVPAEQITLLRKLGELHDQVLHRGGYPYDPAKLNMALQNLVDGIGIREDLGLEQGSVVVNYDDPRWPIPENEVSRSGTAIIRYVERIFDHNASKREVLDWINGDDALRLCCQAEIEARLDQAAAAGVGVNTWPIEGIYGVFYDGSAHRVTTVIGHGWYARSTLILGLQDTSHKNHRHFAVLK